MQRSIQSIKYLTNIWISKYIISFGISGASLVIQLYLIPKYNSYVQLRQGSIWMLHVLLKGYYRSKELYAIITIIIIHHWPSEYSYEWAVFYWIEILTTGPLLYYKYPLHKYVLLASLHNQCSLIYSYTQCFTRRNYIAI